MESGTFPFTKPGNARGGVGLEESMGSVLAM